MKSPKKSGVKSETKKPRKGKATPSSSRSASRAVAAQTSPQVLQITTRKPRARNGLRVHSQVESVSEASRPEAGPRSAAERCQQLYVAAHTRDATGRIQLDLERLAQSLAETGIGVHAEQALYSLALMAAADGHAALFEEDVIAAIAKLI